MTQKGVRMTTYMSSREKGMLDAICETTGENMSQVVTALVMQEFYRLKLNKDFNHFTFDTSDKNRGPST
jgi:hypothetical protein